MDSPQESLPNQTESSNPHPLDLIEGYFIYALKERREHADRRRCVMSMNNPLADNALGKTTTKPFHGPLCDDCLIRVTRIGSVEQRWLLSERNWTARSQAAKSNNWSMKRFYWRTSSALTHRACPLRVLCLASYPAIVRRAARNSRKLCLAFTRRLIAR
jgi:hypothetical protein